MINDFLFIRRIKLFDFCGQDAIAIGVIGGSGEVDNGVFRKEGAACSIGVNGGAVAESIGVVVVRRLPGMGIRDWSGAWTPLSGT